MSEMQRLSWGERLARWPDWRVRLLLLGGFWTLVLGMSFDRWPVVAMAALYLAGLGVLLFRKR